MGLTELIAGIGWAGWGLTLAVCYVRGWRPWAPPDLSPKRAQLVNDQGRLDSVRTITGPPPTVIEARAGVYRLDRTTTGPHYTYRKS